MRCIPLKHGITRHMARSCGALAFLLLAVATFVAPAFMSPAMAAQITGVRSWSGPDSTRLVLELSGANEFQVSADSTPGRLVVAVPGATTTLDAARWPAQVGQLQAMRLDTSRNPPRLLLDLAQESEAKVFALGPGGNYGHRLVIDLLPRQPGAAIPAAVATPAPVVVPPPPPAIENRPKRTGGGRDIIVSIDAGHGGADPGAIGRSGLYEKHVTLAIARAVAEYLNRQDGISARLTRDSDFFIPLQRRRQIARHEHKADIFMSIHADSAPNRAARGASVFALSLQGANSATSSFAQRLAEQENKADLIGGAVVESGTITDVLASLAVEGSLKHSLDMGGILLSHMHPVVGKLHSPRVEQAGFAVLKEPGMVSLLVETGFISNAEEEAKLGTAAYQRELAQAIGEGVLRFCRQYPVPGTWFDRN